MRILEHLLAGVLLAAMAFPAPVSAQAAAIERARGHMERGQALYLQARFEEAAAEFQAAYAAQAFSAFLYNAGVALERAGQPAQAAELFEQYVARDAGASDAAEVRARIRALREAIRAPETPAPAPEGQEAAPEELPDDFKSLLSVRTNPEGASIVIRRGEAVVARGPAPFAHTLEQGRYNVTVEHPDYQTVNQDMRIEPGRVYVVIVEMSQGQFLGYLRVVSDVAGAQVYIDDREQGPRGQTPFEAPIPVGTHHVWVERPGYEVGEADAEIGVGEDVSLRVDLSRVAYGRLRVVANVAGARVFVDGALAGRVPFEGQVPAGTRRVRVEADGMKAWDTPVTIERGQLTPLRARLRPDVDRGAAWISSVFSALFLGGGITLAVIGNDLAAQLSAQADAGLLASDDARLGQGFFFYVGADAAFGLSLIVGALALYYFVYDPLPPSVGTVLEARDWAFSPILDPASGTAGLGFMGRF